MIARGDEVGVVGGAGCSEGGVEKGGGASGVACGSHIPQLHDPGMAPLSTPGGRPKTRIPEAASSVQHGATHDQGLAHGVV